ncbi:MAG: hypothetical protein WBN99_10405, partial [Mycobacterium sp.]
PWPIAAAKLFVAAAAAALTMALLGYAGGGRLGNFGDVGVDQVTFGPAVFLWFVSIGGLTVAMAGGLARRPKRVKPAPEPEPEPEPEADFDDEDAITDIVLLDAQAEFPERAESFELGTPRAPAEPHDDPPLDPEEHFMVDGDVPDVTAAKPREQGD